MARPQLAVLVVVGVGTLVYAFQGSPENVRLVTLILAGMAGVLSSMAAFGERQAVHRLRAAIMILALVSLGLAVGGACYAWFGRDIRRVDTLDGRPFDAIERQLSADHLQLGEVKRRPAKAPIGQVVGQHPAAGTKVDAQTEVSLEVSTGVAVPKVIGVSRVKAIEAVGRAQLTPVAQTDWDDAKKGTAFAQKPKPGVMVNPRTTVKIAVSDGIRPNPVIRELARCVSLNEAEAAIGFGLRRVPGEACGFERRATNVATARCPVRWVCTWGPGSGRPEALIGFGQRANVFEGTWRFVPAYPSADKVRNGCRFIRAMRTALKARYGRRSGDPRC